MKPTAGDRAADAGRGRHPRTSVRPDSPAGQALYVLALALVLGALIIGITAA
ncbi:hypothetical protein VM636_18390 [Streptomyces sp. SCSIO 75703]|uniref:hypothetical protein n=1 Tax=Streptomyces sp. SCSIO 75703 TaxID=3112165 RepID=UPI000B27938C